MPGANNTKMALAHSLQDLMLTMPLEKISVNDIVEHVSMGRNTFYYHFEDKYDLVNWYFQTGFTHLLATRTGRSDWQSNMVDIENYFRENHIFYTNALGYNGQNSLRSYIFDFVRELFVQRVTINGQVEKEGMTAADLRFAGDFFAGAIMGILMNWVEHGMKEHIADYTNCLRELYDGRMLSMFFQNSSFLGNDSTPTT